MYNSPLEYTDPSGFGPCVSNHTCVLGTICVGPPGKSSACPSSPTAPPGGGGLSKNPNSGSGTGATIMGTAPWSNVVMATGMGMVGPRPAAADFSTVRWIAAWPVAEVAGQDGMARFLVPEAGGHANGRRAPCSRWTRREMRNWVWDSEEPGLLLRGPVYRYPFLK